MSPTPPTIAIALATYNGARYIEDQVRSFLTQTVPVTEIVLADDASGDDTIAIVERIVAEAGARAPRLLVLSAAEPFGVTKNFERAIAATTSEFVALSDQDDVWHPRKLERLLDALTSAPKVLLANSDARLVDERGAPLESTLFERLEITAPDLNALRNGDAFGVLLRRNLVTGATVVFRRKLFDDARPFPVSWVHDEWLAIIAAASGRIVPLSERLMDYRQHGANQIGVARPSLQAKVARVLSPRGDRNRLLAERSQLLREALQRLGDAVDPHDVRRAAEKARFETRRAELPANRLRRIVPVMKLAASGDYSRYASQGRADVLRDLLQPQ
jgi:hypothetical protein